MQLWEYLDGACSEADRQRISLLIATDAVWQQQYEELSSLHHSLAANMEAEQPSMRFAKNVMEAVAATHIAPATTRYINRSVIRGIAAFFIITITLVLGYTIADTNWSSGTPVAMPKVDISSLFSNNFISAAIGINIVLALVLADVLLRRKQMQQ